MVPFISFNIYFKKRTLPAKKENKLGKILHL